MARINIEDCWWTDPRREMLGGLVGNHLTADGLVIRAWRLAQEFWKKDKGLIPLHIWDTLHAGPSLVQAGLAEIQASGVYVRGSSQYLDWAREQRLNAKKGGKKSATRPRNAKGQLTKMPKQNPSEVQATPKVVQPSVSGSLSVSGSDSDSNSVNLAKIEISPTPVGVYVQAYKKRYGHRPEIGGKEGKILSSFASNYPETWIDLINGFLDMPDSWATQRSHPPEVLTAKVNEVRRYLETGKVITKTVIKHAEELIDRAQGTNKRPRRSIDELEQERELQNDEQKLIVGGET